MIISYFAGSNNIFTDCIEWKHYSLQCLKLGHLPYLLLGGYNDKFGSRMIEQEGMTFDHDFCYSFSFSSSLFFRRKEKTGREKSKSWSKDMPFCLISRIRYTTLSGRQYPVRRFGSVVAHLDLDREVSGSTHINHLKNGTACAVHN